jgi:hypothetical protein
MFGLGEEKLIEYERKRGLLFLLNRDKPSNSLHLYTIKLKYREKTDYDSDEGK